MTLPQNNVNVADLTIKLLPWQKDWIFSPEKLSVVSSGWGCVAGETLIGGIPIAERRQEELSTLFGLCRPSNPYLKGRADLYRVRTLSGRQVDVTLDHRFLTLTGWSKLRDLSVGSPIAA